MSKLSHAKSEINFAAIVVLKDADHEQLRYQVNVDVWWSDPFDNAERNLAFLMTNVSIVRLRVEQRATPF